MEDNKLVLQTVYVPGNDYNTQYFVYIKNKAGYIYVEKKENQIVMSFMDYEKELMKAETKGYLDCKARYKNPF